MPALPVELRERVVADIGAATDHYLASGGAALGLRFVDAVEHTLRQVGRSPRSGSQRFAHELGIPGLRARSVARFRYVVFYVDHEEHVDVWRVLHARRDIPALLIGDSG